jgi:hypothetical protein
MQNLYQIGMQIVLAGNAIAGLQAISKHLAGIHTQVGQIHTGWKNWAAILGVGGIAAGVGIIGGLKTIASHGDKLIDQQVKLTNQGYKQNEVLKLQADYYDRIARAVPTSTIAGYLKTTNELRSVTGEGPEGLAKAGELAIKAMKIDALLSNTFGTNKEGSYYKLLRSEEMKGIATNDARRDQMTDAAMSYISAFGGKLTADDFQNMARTGGAAFMNADVAKSMGPLAVMAADLHGGPAGTALMTLQQFQTGAHTLSKQQAGVLEQLGLLDMSKTTKTGFGGSRLQLAPGAMTGALQYSGDLPGWIREVVWPAIMKEAKGDKAVAESLLGKMFPNRNANKAAHMFGDEGFADQIAKDMGLAKQALPWEEQYKNFIEKNPLGVKQGFHDQFESMMQSLGGPLAQAAIPVMKSMTEIFTSIGKWANTNPETIKIVGIGLGFLATGLIALGATAVIAAAAAMAPTAAIGIAVVAIAGFIGTLAALNWDIVKQGLGAVTGFIQGWVDKFKDWVGGKGDGPTTTPNGSTYDAMGNIIKGAYHPGGGANDDNSWSDIARGELGRLSAMRHAAVAGRAIGSSSLFFKGRSRQSHIRKSAIRHGAIQMSQCALRRARGSTLTSAIYGTSFRPIPAPLRRIRHSRHEFGGLGDALVRQTGKDARRPLRPWQQIDFALGYAKTHGWRDWHGRRASWHRLAMQGLSGRARRNERSQRASLRRREKSRSQSSSSTPTSTARF